MAIIAAFVPAAQLAVAQQNLKIGRLRCNVSGGLGLIITSTKEMTCVFTSLSGAKERYYGTIRKFGLDIGVTDRGLLAWTVFAPTKDPGPWALAGEYAGIDASATIGAGVGANLLIGGSQQTISLQPLSVQAQTGFALAGGVAELSLRPGQ
ncbi:MAG: DUF992 domain-containing protein [Beijerinckiaceae bacterium]|nr:DUF992 domain-containing protein [Beijerinckiaceae bacterium]